MGKTRVGTLVTSIRDGALAYVGEKAAGRMIAALVAVASAVPSALAAHAASLPSRETAFLVAATVLPLLLSLLFAAHLVRIAKGQAGPAAPGGTVAPVGAPAGPEPLSGCVIHSLTIAPVDDELSITCAVSVYGIGAIDALPQKLDVMDTAHSKTLVELLPGKSWSPRDSQWSTMMYAGNISPSRKKTLQRAIGEAMATANPCADDILVQVYAKLKVRQVGATDARLRLLDKDAQGIAAPITGWSRGIPKAWK
jgi:hypothetical protein